MTMKIAIRDPIASPGEECPEHHKWTARADRVTDPMDQKWPEHRNRSAYKLKKINKTIKEFEIWN
jgi:hypothetical protein